MELSNIRASYSSYDMQELEVNLLLFICKMLKLYIYFIK